LIKEAISKLKLINLAAYPIAIYEAKLKSIRDRNARDAYVRDDGIATGKAQFIIELLEVKGTVSPALKERILQEKNSTNLSRWHKLASQIDTIDQFESEFENIKVERKSIIKDLFLD
ncbi:MAG: hypothetical protein PHS74_09330, partial [Lachnospiraceae bacterium]|nr:hypothetical protein [Lachnospiraceae bacterium]